MPLGMGETIGAAYVRILADGAGFGESLDREMARNQEKAGKSGKKYEESWARGFEKQQNKDLKRLNKSLEDGFSRANTIEKGIGGANWQKARRRLEKQFGQEGVILADKLEEGLRKGLTFSEVNDKLRNLGGGLHDAAAETEKIAQAFGKARDHIERMRVVEERTQRVEGLRQSLAQKMNEDFDKGRAHIARTRAETERVYGSLKKMQGAALRLNSAFDRGLLTSKQMAEHFGRLPGNIRKSETALGRVASEFDKIAGGLGNAFGKGNRNNFFNVVGSLVEGAGKIPGKVVQGVEFGLRGGAKLIEWAGKAVTKVGQFVSNTLGQFNEWFTKVGDGLQKVGGNITDFGEKAGQALSKVGEAAASSGEELAATGPGGMIAGAVAIVGALLALPVIIGTVVSAFSVLVAAATAVISSLAYAVVGAVAPLAGLLLPVVAVVGVVMLAINKLTAVNKANNKAVSAAQTHVDAYRKALANATPGTQAYARAQANLKGAIETQAQAQAKAGDTLGSAVTKIKGAFDQLRTAAANSLFGGKGGGAALSGLSSALTSMIPLVTVVGHALQGVGISFSQGLKSGGFKDFIATLTKNLPGQITSLGAIVKSTFGGLGGVFTALMPSTNAFAKGIQGAAEDFNKWANSAKGQKSLQKFFDDARVSAGKVWDLIKALAIDIAAILGPGKKSGDSIIDQITGSLKDFKTWLDANPDALQNWFQSGKDAAKKVGDIINEVIAFVKKMDTPENRKHADQLFEGIAVAIASLGIAIDWINGVWKAFIIFLYLNPATLPLMLMLPVLGKAFMWLGGVIKQWALDALGAINWVLGGISTFLHAAANIPGPMGRAFGNAAKSVDGAKVALQGTITALTNLGHQAAGGITIPVFTPGLDQATIDLANLKWITQNIPKEVTVGVTAKLKAQTGSGSAGGAMAAGGLATYAQTRTIGEAGPEAVVPLHRPLSMVDPAVRQLSAFAQGKPMASGGVVGAGKVVNVGGLTVITPTADPFAVAQETVNKLVGASYI